MHNIVTLTTDFGTRDGFIGTMKGVILGIQPATLVVDISHHIAPQHIDAAAFVLFNSYRYFPQRSVHVVVVDPGVGSDRHILCVDSGDYLFLAPDNGVLKYIFNKYPGATVHRVTNESLFLTPRSQTFHGRDIFAPVAAKLASGTTLQELGPAIDSYVLGNLPRFHRRGGTIYGAVMYIDGFGNVITNIPHAQVKKSAIECFCIGAYQIDTLVESYAAGADRQMIAIPGSSGYWEIAVKQDSAKTCLRCEINAPLRVELKEDNPI